MRLLAEAFAILSIGVLGPSLLAQQPAKAGAGDAPEVHLVSLYEGNHKTNGKIHGGKASVHVDRPGITVILVLSSYDSVTWEVTVAPKSEVKKVILAGYHRQAVTGVMADVEHAYHEGNKATHRFYAPYAIDSSTFRPTVQAIHRLTGLNIASFQGRYAFDPKMPFVVNEVERDARLRSDYPQPTPAAELPKLEFKALQITGNAPFATGSYGDFTLSGPRLDALKPLPRDVRRLAVDPETQKCYAIGLHEVLEVDLQKRTTTKIDMGLDVPRLSWPCGITFDTKRKRLLVVSLGGSGYLYEFTPKAGKWSVLADMNNVDLAALAYHAKDDALYGLGAPMGDGERAKHVLYQYNPQGALLKKISLGDPIFPGALGRMGGIETPPQLISVGDHLIIISKTGGERPGQTGGETFMFLVDPKTGTGRLTWRN